MNSLPFVKNANVQKLAFLLGLFVFIIIHRVWGYVGHFGYDDMIYCEFAHQIATHSFSLTDDHYSYRIALSGLVGLAFKLFGVNDAAASVMPMLITLLTGMMVLYAHPNRSVIAVCLSLAIFLLNNWTFFYADKVMPDSLVAFAAMGAFATIYRFKFIQKDRRLLPSLVHAFAFCAFLMFGFLAKETVWLLVPALAMVFISDLVQKQLSKFWLFSILIGTCLLSAYFIWIWQLTGHPFSRFQAIAANGYFMPSCSFDRLPWQDLIERITYKLLFVFIGGGMIISMAFTLPAIFRHKLSTLLSMPDGATYWTSVATMLFLSGYFMTTSFSHYMPMCPDPRHYLFIIPPAAIIAGTELRQFLKYASNKTFWLILLLCFSAIAYQQQQFGILCLVYLPLTLLFGLRCLLTAYPKTQGGDTHSRFGFLNKKSSYLLFSLGVVYILLGYQAYHIYSAQNNSYHDQKRLIMDFFKPMPHKALIITNEVEKNFARFYYEFTTSQHQYITFKEAKSYSFSDEVPTYVLVNGYIHRLSGSNKDEFPNYVKDPPPSFEKVMELNSFSVYQVNNLNALKQSP